MLGRGIRAGGKGIYNVGKYGTTTPSGIALTGATAGPFIYNALKADPEKTQMEMEYLKLIKRKDK